MRPCTAFAKLPFPRMASWVSGTEPSMETWT